jgi:hypothetical protein
MARDGCYRAWLQRRCGHLRRTTCVTFRIRHVAICYSPTMVSGDDQERWRHYLRGAAVGLIVFASTISTDLANFVGTLDNGRLLTFSLGGLLAAVAATLTAIESKKKSSLAENNFLTNSGNTLSGLSCWADRRRSDSAIPPTGAAESSTRVAVKGLRAATRAPGSPGEFHPEAPTEPCLTVSRYTALLIESVRTRASTPSGRIAAALFAGARSTSVLLA